MEAASRLSENLSNMSSSNRRLFYDPKNPKLLSDEEINELSPAECDAACLQVDQILVSLLQNIDANFGRTHRTITHKILPEVERYGEASRGIWEGLKFWQHFFEASANVQLSGYDDDETETSKLTEDERRDESLQNDLASEDVSQDVPPSPNEDQDLSSSSLDPAVPSGPPVVDMSHQSGSTASLRRPVWNDLSFDSPDNTLQNPTAQNISHILNNSHSNSLASGFTASPIVPGDDEGDSGREDGSPAPRRKSAGRGSILLHQVIMKNMIQTNHSRPKVSTPAKPRGIGPEGTSGRIAFPAEVNDPGWNGIADLRKTTLESFTSPSKKKLQPCIGESSKKGKSREWEEEDSMMAGIPPPQTLHFSVPRSKLARTPAKEAARLVTRDILETARFRAGYANPADIEDSPLIEPPSVLREWNARGYESMFRNRTGVESNRKGFEEEGDSLNSIQQDESTLQLQAGSKDATIESRASQSRDSSKLQPSQSRDGSNLQPSQTRDVSKSLIDLWAGDSERLSIKGPYDHLEDRDEFIGKRPLPDSSFDEESWQPDPKRVSLSRSHEDKPDEQDRSYEEGSSLPLSPTLFGVGKMSNNQNQFESSRAGPSNVLRGSLHPFVPMQPEQMDTFFGGDLLESECFEPSPLQGKRVKHIEQDQ
ncbi:uncharacterized protein MELLADRAFT_109120 [Melampsora larici-populina 98AG31]|uniref:DASH complex subunit ASK1 n=1 Tax=Melampsora larici-populina (strain 98AG31 / pathotype 3-4-7) TaxID=747676 RepID=F4RVD5_MELLP|nr:uncharacterized protein MELLADRAFT_109120 [Melampsora larici-populina 98AG31]EGG03603.1 hypothetical protein MELLADRAFT_109120 [Melampsora larici-populina 98AG31]